MKNILFISLTLSALILGLTKTHADDTEIFFSEEDLSDTEAFQPNVLFIFDTSGSMGDEITSYNPYDPDVDYGDSSEDYVYIHRTNYSWYRSKRIPISDIHCQAILDKLEDTENPWLLTRAAWWDDDDEDWNRFRYYDEGEGIVECKDDSGTHGAPDLYSASETYADNGSSGPYSSSSSDEINWDGSSFRDRIYVSANYHDYLQDDTQVTTQPKTDIMKEAAVDLVNNFTGLNLGLMRFGGSSGGYVKHHFADIETDRTEIITSINALGASGNTPLAETLWEAHRYFAGLSVDYGTEEDRDENAISSGNYISPIGGEDSLDCQANYVVYLTDGQPYSDSGKDDEISDLDGIGSCSHSDGTSSSSNTCLDEMADYMASYDYNDSVDGVQNVKTYTIGFDIDMDLLEQTAVKGLGEYYTASSSTELRSAFNEIFLDILSSSTSFVAPAVSVNAFNSFQNNEEVYYALFEPNTSPRWYGNVKKYTINADGIILDANDNDAVDETTGYFAPSAKSYWSTVTDGNVVQDGGAASLLTASRTIYTTIGTDTTDVSLNTSANTITASNTNITKDMFGLDDDFPDADFDKLLGWVVGQDPEADTVTASNFMADPLHSRPVVITYGGTEANPDQSLVVTTNDGGFHLVDAESGTTTFSYIPQDMLPIQYSYFADTANADREYGLDGPMTVWVEESNDIDEENGTNDVTIEPADGDHVYAYFGQRRGGSNYYALDITNRSSPKLMWQITGGAGDFTNMGQSWSKIVRGKVNWNCSTTCTEDDQRDVLFFGGGYDTVHDSATSATSGDAGAAIYMVDALTGELLWSAGDTSVNSSYDLDLNIANSIPGDITVIDINGDDLSDVIFAVDILGKLWRIDIRKNNQSASEFARGGGLIADLSDTNDLRRFYTGPAVSIGQTEDTAPFFVISMGTGYMASPRDETISDRFYVLFDHHLFTHPLDENGDIEYTTITNSDLLDLNNSDTAPTPVSDGYYKDALTTGEKFLRSPLTTSKITFYTSYLPSGGSEETTCGLGYLGSGRLYAINFITGESVLVSDYLELAHAGIPPEAVVLNVSDGSTTKKVVCVGTECFTEDDPNFQDDAFGTDYPHKTFWREN